MPCPWCATQALSAAQLAACSGSCSQADFQPLFQSRPCRRLLEQAQTGTARASASVSSPPQEALQPGQQPVKQPAGLPPSAQSRAAQTATAAPADAAAQTLPQQPAEPAQQATAHMITAQEDASSLLSSSTAALPDEHVVPLPADEVFCSALQELQAAQPWQRRPAPQAWEQPQPAPGGIDR